MDGFSFKARICICQIGLSIVLLALTTVGAGYFSARIYPVDILKYGKRPSRVEF